MIRKKKDKGKDKGGGVMISAVMLTFCLLGKPSDCLPPKKFFIESEENLALPMLCMKQAQHMAVEWIEAHPGYFLAKYRCQSNVIPNARNTSNQSIATFIDDSRDDRRAAANTDRSYH
jgi:hypothetical protein